MGKFIEIKNSSLVQVEANKWLARELAVKTNFELSSEMAQSLKWQRVSLQRARTSTHLETRQAWLKRWKLERGCYLALVRSYNTNLMLTDLTSPSASSDWMGPLELLSLARGAQAVRLNN